VPLGSNLNLGIAIVSYNGALNFGLAGDFAVMHDLEDLVVAPASLCPCEGVLPAVPKFSSTCSARMEGDDGCEGCGQAGRDRR
jgi:hypothetical protein